MPTRLQMQELEGDSAENRAARATIGNPAVHERGVVRVDALVALR
jgi:hypothetical protein